VIPAEPYVQAGFFYGLISVWSLREEEGRPR
jgi:hypothetical protein